MRFFVACGLFLGRFLLIAADAARFGYPCLIIERMSILGFLIIRTCQFALRGIGMRYLQRIEIVGSINGLLFSLERIYPYFVIARVALTVAAQRNFNLEDSAPIHNVIITLYA